MTRWHYSRPKFQITVAVAAAMTGMVAATVWMLLSAFGVARANFYAGLSALVFFAFCSAAMLLRYMSGGVVLAVQPTGLFDARWRSQAVAWEDIREVVIRRIEDEIELDVYLWRPQARYATPDGGRGRRPDHVIELASLDGGARDVIDAIERHAAVRMDSAARGAPTGGPGDGRADGQMRVEG